MAVIDSAPCRLFRGLDSLHPLQKIGDRLLPHGANHHIDIIKSLEPSVRPRGNRRNWQSGGPFASGGPRFVRTHSSPATTPSSPSTRVGLGLPEEDDAILLRKLVFVGEGGHLVFAAAVDQIHRLGAEAARGCDHIDPGVTRADARNAAADRHLPEGLAFRLLDKFDCAINAMQIIPRQIELPGFAQAGADENRIESFFEGVK